MKLNKKAEMIKAELPRLELQNAVEIAERYAKAIANMNVPENLTILGGSGEGGGAEALPETFMQLSILDKLDAKTQVKKTEKTGK